MVRRDGQVFQHAEQLADVIEDFTDDRLDIRMPGREYDFYSLLHRIVQHSLYHGRQIAIVKTGLAFGLRVVRTGTFRAAPRRWRGPT